MLASTIAMAVLAAILLLPGHHKGSGKDVAGLKIAFHLTGTILLKLFIIARGDNSYSKHLIDCISA